MPTIGPEQRLWCLATSALLVESGHRLHHALAVVPRNSPWADDEGASLRRAWRIRSSDDLRKQLAWLWRTGHRREFAEHLRRLQALDEDQRQARLQQELPEDREARLAALKDRMALAFADKLGGRGLLAWDLVRYGQLIRSGHACGLIDEDEAWKRLHTAAVVLQAELPGWRAVGEEYLMGRAYWSITSYMRRKAGSEAALERLSTAAHSPWQVVPWDLDLQTASGEGDPMLAVERRACEPDEPDALVCWRMGMRHEYGLGVKKNQQQAFTFYRKAADAGDAISQFMVGYRIEKAQGTQRDFPLAMHYYELAAEQGHAMAQLNLGFDLWAGRGGEKDFTRAVHWYRKAAEQGNRTAMMNLGVCYFNGQGVDRDLNTAKEWYGKAAEAGGKLAQRCQASIAKIERLLAEQAEQTGAEEF